MALMWRLEYKLPDFFFHLKFMFPCLVANLHLVNLVQSTASLVFNKMIFKIATITTKSSTIKPSPPTQKQHFILFYFGYRVCLCYLLSWNSLCSLGCRDPLASASQVLGLKTVGNHTQLVCVF